MARNDPSFDEAAISVQAPDRFRETQKMTVAARRANLQLHAMEANPASKVATRRSRSVPSVPACPSAGMPCAGSTPPCRGPELGVTPATRARVAEQVEPAADPITIVRLIGMRCDDDGTGWSSTATHGIELASLDIWLFCLRKRLGLRYRTAQRTLGSSVREAEWRVQCSGTSAYERVSTKRQGASGLGLEAQRKAIDDFVASRGAEVIARFTEVESGSAPTSTPKTCRRWWRTSAPAAQQASGALRPN